MEGRGRYTKGALIMAESVETRKRLKGQGVRFMNDLISLRRATVALALCLLDMAFEL